MWGGAGMGRLGWMAGTRQLLNKRGMAEHWNDPAMCALITKDQWKSKVYERVHYEEERK